MTKSILYVTLLLVSSFCLPSQAIWTPSGSEYSPPSGATLVVSEDYGTLADGVGSWSNAGGGAIATTSDSIVVDVAENYVYLPLPWRPRATNYVIDIGVKSWSTPSTATTWDGIWSLENADASNCQKFVMRGVDDIYATSGGQSMPFASNTAHVIRLSDPSGPWSPYSAVLTADYGVSITDNGSNGGIALNALTLGTGTNGESTIEIAWVRIYDGATSVEAPLVAADAPLSPEELLAPIGGGYVPPTTGELVLAEDYGSDHHGLGSWISGGGATTITENDDSIVIYVSDYSKAKLSLPVNPKTENWTIDVGLKSWSSTSNHATLFSGKWIINSYWSDTANGYQHRFIFRDSNPGADILGANSNDTMACLEDETHVLRFTNSAGTTNNATLISDFGADTCSEAYNWNGAKEDVMLIECGGDATKNFTAEIAWVRVYSNVTTTEAPAEAQELWVPLGTEYVAPEGGLLVLSEVYDSGDPNAIGSWVNDGGDTTIVSKEDYLEIHVADGSRAYMDLPFEPRFEDYVIDVGLKKWSTVKGGTSYNGVWGINSFGGTSGLIQEFAMRSVDISAKNSGEIMPFAQMSEHVMRFTSADDSVNEVTLVSDLGADSCVETYAWSSVNGKVNILNLRASGGADSTVDIAWIKVYKGVTTTDAPLSLLDPKGDLLLPEGATYNTPATGTLIIDEKYGTVNDGVGSWISNGGSTIITQSDEYIDIYVEGSTAQVNLPFVPRFNDYIIDIGLKSWYTGNGISTMTSGQWMINSASGSGFRHTWTMQNNGANECVSSSDSMPLEQNKLHILRLTYDYTEGEYSNATMLSDTEDSCVAPYAWNGGSGNILHLRAAASPANSHTQIAWMKVYTGVSSTDPAIVYTGPVDCDDSGMIYLPGDISGPESKPDCYVDVYDIEAMAANWLGTTN